MKRVADVRRRKKEFMNDILEKQQRGHWAKLILSVCAAESPWSEIRGRQAGLAKCDF